MAIIACCWSWRWIRAIRRLVLLSTLDGPGVGKGRRRPRRWISRCGGGLTLYRSSRWRLWWRWWFGYYYECTKAKCGKGKRCSLDECGGCVLLVCGEARNKRGKRKGWPSSCEPNAFFPREIQSSCRFSVWFCLLSRVVSCDFLRLLGSFRVSSGSFRSTRSEHAHQPLTCEYVAHRSFSREDSRNGTLNKTTSDIKLPSISISYWCHIRQKQSRIYLVYATILFMTWRSNICPSCFTILPFTYDTLRIFPYIIQDPKSKSNSMVGYLHNNMYNLLRKK